MSVLDYLSVLLACIGLGISFVAGIWLSQMRETGLIRAVIVSLGSTIEGMDWRVTKLEDRVKMRRLSPGHLEGSVSGSGEDLWRVALRLVRIVNTLEEREGIGKPREASQSIPGISKLGRSESKLLDLLSKKGPMSSSVLGKELGKSREHTARVMKKLFELGYVERDETVFPYQYRVALTRRARRDSVMLREEQMRQPGS